MKNKEEIYVVIDTPKKAKKVKKVLDMFGEKTYRNDTVEFALNNYKLLSYSEIDNWIAPLNRYTGEEEVSIKELRNILAVEHLKEDDVVVCKEGKGEIAVGIYKEHDEFGFDLRPCVFLDDTHEKSEGCFDTFIRYATEEEKALLEDKPKELTKEEVEKKVVEYAVGINWDYDGIQNYIGVKIDLEEYDKLDGKYSMDKAKVIIEKFKPKSIEVGKWYKGIGDKLIFTTSEEQEGYVKAYGFGALGGWFEDDHDFTWTTDELKEATKEEVEQALIKEAKKRYKVGDKVKSLVTIVKYELVISSIKFNNMGVFGDLWVNSTNETQKSLIFRNGKWAEIVEPVTIKPVINGKDLKVVLDGNPLRCEYSIGKRVLVIDGGSGATGCNGQTGIIVEKPKKNRNGSLHPVIYVKLDNGHTWGLAMDHKIEYLQESSPLTVTLEVKDIATLQVIQKTLKELEEKLTKLI